MLKTDLYSAIKSEDSEALSVVTAALKLSIAVTPLVHITSLSQYCVYYKDMLLSFQLIS